MRLIRRERREGWRYPLWPAERDGAAREEEAIERVSASVSSASGVRTAEEEEGGPEVVEDETDEAMLDEPGVMAPSPPSLSSPSSDSSSASSGGSSTLPELLRGDLAPILLASLATGSGRDPPGDKTVEAEGVGAVI